MGRNQQTFALDQPYRIFSRTLLSRRMVWRLALGATRLIYPSLYFTAVSPAPTF
jgi:hypothetical protein